MFSSKNVSWVWVSTLERKTAFLAIYKPKCARNCPFFFRFRIFRVAWKAYLTSMTSSTTTPGPGTPPTNSRHGRGMTQSLPLSYWSPEKSYMTSSRTATLIYIAALFRVNPYCSDIRSDVHILSQSTFSPWWVSRMFPLHPCLSSGEGRDEGRESGNGVGGRG